jgi:hypothetical protein
LIGFLRGPIHSDGSLDFVSGQIDQVNNHLLFTPDGSDAYSATCYHLGANVEHFTVASNGTLTFIPEQLPYSNVFGQCPYAIAMTPSGSVIASVWADADNQGPVDNFILVFGLDSSTHRLTPPGSPTTASGVGRDAVFDSSGRFLVVAQDNGVGVYQIDQTAAIEVSGSPFAAGTSFSRLTFSPLGRFVVAISAKSQQVSVFTLNNSTGTLTPAPGSPYSTPTPRDLAIAHR